MSVLKVLVTGACGYKGTVLVPKLLAAGHEVVAFDITRVAKDWDDAIKKFFAEGAVFDAIYQPGGGK